MEREAQNRENRKEEEGRGKANFLETLVKKKKRLKEEKSIIEDLATEETGEGVQAEGGCRRPRVLCCHHSPRLTAKETGTEKLSNQAKVTESQNLSPGLSEPEVCP